MEHCPINQNVLVSVLASSEVKTASGFIVPEKDKRLPVEVVVKAVSSAIEDPLVVPGDVVTVYRGSINSLEPNTGLALISYESILTIVK